MLRRWDAFTRFLGDGRICLTNNAEERALRCEPLGRKAWLFCGSDRGGQRVAIMYTLIQSCRLNDVAPQAWLADVLSRIADHPTIRPSDHPVSRLHELLPRHCPTTPPLSPPDPFYTAVYGVEIRRTRWPNRPNLVSRRCVINRGI